MFRKTILTIATATILVSTVASGTASAKTVYGTGITGSTTYIMQKRFKIRNNKAYRLNSYPLCCRAPICGAIPRCVGDRSPFNKLQK